MTAKVIEHSRYLVDHAGITTPPVDPRKLAALCGIRRIVISKTLEVSGELRRDGSELVIRLNAGESEQRRNFTCFHEIAHTFALDNSFGEFGRSDRAFRCSRSSVEERLCDQAAAEMMMPEKLFRPLASRLEPNIESVSYLAERFASSVRATIVRLGQLAMWPVIFIGWKFTSRLGSVKKLRISWSVRPAGVRCFIPLHACASISSGMYATFSASHPTCESEVLNLGSLRGRYLVESRRFGEHVLSIVHDPRLARRT
jgi:hypothetical protein